MPTPQQNRYLRKIKKLRASYRRKMLALFIFALIIGFAGGWFCNSYIECSESKADNVTSEPSPMPSPTPAGVEWDDPLEATEEPEVTEEPTVEPTAEPTAEPTSEPVEAASEESAADPTEEPVTEATTEPAAEPTEEPAAEPAEATEEPTPEPTAEPTPEPAAEVGSIELPVEIGEEYTFTMEVLADGTPRRSLSDEEYFSVPVTITLARHMDNEYYAATYSESYMLKGNEAGCELIVTLGDCEGLNELSMQSAIVVVIQNADGEVHPGYQFTDAEISGETDSTISTGASATIYKRYTFGALEGLDYLTVSYYENGEMKTVYFSLIAPEPEDTPEPMVDAESEAAATPAPSSESYTIGDSGEGVILLQRKLIQLGYLSGQPDGVFGQWTASAVKSAQKDFGLEQTGIADAEFLDILYSK